jgi:hypothetical protein
MKIRYSDIPVHLYLQLAGQIDAAAPECSRKRVFSMALIQFDLDTAYQLWRAGPIVNEQMIPQIENTIREIRDGYSARRGI